ncbi:MAG: N-acetylglucosamine-6-phosphate deacetylase [Anaerolineae bacterium]|nr:N-acetylglucosamine-6-phosphate deacetylase [Anaerolineae bacterium]MDW8099434.1 N-acetylglucosamine-6-phosphate deacetylase [Anaerolineae bacterium]
MQAIVNGQLFTPQPIPGEGVVLIEGGYIVAAGPANSVRIPPGSEVIDAGGRKVVPGLVDVHIHGLLGYSCMGAELAEVAAILPRFGVTAFCATTITAPIEHVQEALGEMAEVIERRPQGARILGIHLEGPHLSPKRSGMAKADLQRPLTWDEFQRLQEAAHGNIRMITFAPEEDRAAELIPRLRKLGVVPVIGHSDATFDQVTAWVRLGLAHATHAFNAMRGFHHREPGVLGAVLLYDEIIAQLIADGHHVHPGAMALLWKVKGPERTALISDAIPYAGLPPGQYEWEGYRLILDGETCRLADGTLAGATTLLNQDIMTLIRLVGVPFADALAAATRTPALSIGHGTWLGQLAPGFAADVAILEEDGQAWQTWVSGELVFSTCAS